MVNNNLFLLIMQKQIEMTDLEKIEFATLVLAIVEAKHSLVIERVCSFAWNLPREYFEVSANAEYPTVSKMSRQGLLPGVRFIVETIRKEEEMKLAQMVANLEVPCA